MPIDLILGTAGHIDHGKTSLIRALTGTDTDRLPEEKRRGITIELGFAELEIGRFRLGIVDVPGHERFVRNMLAGATGMDLAMLVVAADDSVKPQTREHLEILRLLNLKAGIIALSKCDLVDSDWLSLVEDEVREIVSGSFLENAPIVRTSASTGMGLDELREKVEAAATKACAESGREPGRARSQTPFRMAIDRTFTIAGHGTVVTGSIGSGQAELGDELVIQPGGHRVRVRGLQNHDRQVELVHRGQRAAINVAGVHHEQIERGQEICSTGHLLPSRLVTVDLQLLKSAPRPLKDRTRVRFHVGTAELLATVRLLGRETLLPGERAAAQVFLSNSAVAVWSQPYVLRCESPIVTIGGGRILDPNAERLRRPDTEQLSMLSQLGNPNPTDRASAALYFAGLRDWKPQDLPRTAGVEQWDEARDALLEKGLLREIQISPTRTLRVHQLVFARLCNRIAAVLGKLHDLHPLRTWLDRQLVANSFRYLTDNALLLAALKQMTADHTIKFTDKGIALVGRGPKLSHNEQKLLSRLVDDYRAAGFEVPTVAQYQKQVTRNQESVPQLLALAAANGDLVEISSDYYLHANVERESRETLAEKLSAADGMTMSEIRETLNTSRKYAVPFCEYLDRIGFTKRNGDLRVLAEQ